ncbi:MAG: glycosyltransferase [Crocinitomicaceae bacterium]|nr:glycosyltransferase [Crocinitomicaceae bacterium]|tara:strand:- start:18062 stop:18688 length:627 start_codon:yes stop_codon:yes gene_type:complete
MFELSGEVYGNLLMIFAKNSSEGKVKTRLAKDIGDKKALEIYQLLLKHTRDVALGVNCFRMVVYSDFIDFEDHLFNNHYFLKDEQSSGNLGERLSNSFKTNFEEGFDNIVCIGSDCFELTSEIIEDAFEKLKNNDVVIGPAKDGGYYLIGLKKMHSQLFENKEWSTPNILLDTLLDLKNLNLKYELLPTLSDVDNVDDLDSTLKAVLD